MYKSETTVRVRYAEIDQMGYCYYGNYATYFEVGRVEALRSLGIRYRDLEESGVMLPVLNVQINYKRPARYDDQLTIETRITELPSARIRFEYTCTRNDEVLTTGETTLAFLRTSDHRPVRAPEHLLNALQPYFK